MRAHRSAIGAALDVWRTLLASQLREQPARLALGVLAIAIGVALASAIYRVNAVAVAQFDGAARRLIGAADLVVRGSRTGFDERLFARLARDPRVRAVDPVLEVSAAIAGRHRPLRVIGIDPFRAAAFGGPLLGALGASARGLLRPDGILLSAAAAGRLGVGRGAALPVVVGDAVRRLRVVGVLPAAAEPQTLGLMDIASAQWAFDRVGRLSRIDLRLEPGVDPHGFGARLARRLPYGVHVIGASEDTGRTAAATRAYRVNLDLLASIALATGAFLIFATQSLAVLRRRGSLALLRALGVTRGELEIALAAEGASLGALGALLGLGGGAVLASAALAHFGGDLGVRSMAIAGVAPSVGVAASAGFFLLGTAVATLGAWVPAHAAAAEPPAAALKGASRAVQAAPAAGRGIAGLVLCAAGVGFAFLPPIHALPVFGYAAIASLLLGTVMIVPIATFTLLRALPDSGWVLLDTAIAQLRDGIGPATASVDAVLVSFALMVAMTTMVHSFRVSFEHWLGQLLPADVEMRVPLGADTARWTPTEQARIAAITGVARAEFRRTRRITLDPARPPITLIARRISLADAGAVLPLVHAIRGALPGSDPPAWISEGFGDLYGAKIGEVLRLPIDGIPRRFVVAGMWRDYARSDGSVVVPRSAYAAATGDRTATEGSLWLVPGANVAAIEGRVRAVLAPADALEIRTSGAIRTRSLRVFDQAFAVTYALEAVAVAIGVAGVGFAIGSTATARRAEFGMLRHLGLRRHDVIALLTEEGIVLTTLGVLYGWALGLILSIVLIDVVNRQSFHWSIDLSVPLGGLLALGAALVAAAAATALIAGRGAVAADAIQVVREDW